MQALSHFSYHTSVGLDMVCDLQGGRYGDCYVLTDPVILSVTGSYGPTDLGSNGISNFFHHHKCSKFCRGDWRKPAQPKSHYQPDSGTTFEMTDSKTKESQGMTAMQEQADKLKKLMDILANKLKAK